MDGEGPPASAAAYPPGVLGEQLGAAQRGDTLAMNDLMELLAPFVSRICGPIALSHAADAAQEALTVVFRRLPTLRDPAALHGWVRAIAIREAVRVAQRYVTLTVAEFPDLPSPGDIESASDIRDVLARMPPEHRAVLVLRDLEGLSEHEAAAVLAVPRGTVKSRLHRARRGFREAWIR
jgi:RNA polymerase sigma factor (sigma-70 family)